MARHQATREREGLAVDIEPFEDALTHAILVCMAQDRLLTELQRELVLARLEVERLRLLVESREPYIVPVPVAFELPQGAPKVREEGTRLCQDCGRQFVGTMGAKYCRPCRTDRYKARGQKIQQTKRERRHAAV